MELLERLEISILNLSEVLVDNLDFRADSEYFRKKYLSFDKFLKDRKSDKISKYAKVSDGDHSKFPENQIDEIRYLQAKDIKNHFIEDNNPVFVSKEYFEKNKRSHVKEENIILSIMGSVGDIAITPKGFKPTLANRAVAIIKDIKDINPYYLFTYLGTNYGQLQIERQKNGGVQERINLDVLSKVKIPFVGTKFQINIAEVITFSHLKRKESKSTYLNAENILLKEIGFYEKVTGLNPVEVTNYNVKTFKDSFGVTGRLDSEYYQKKYEDFEKLILENKNGYSFVKNEFEHITKKSKKDKVGYNYIEIGDVNVNDGSCKSSYVEAKDLPANAKTLVKKGDLLISNVRPYRGAVTLIDFEDNDLIVSGAFTVLREKEESIFVNEVLKVLLRTSVYKEWLLKFNVGTSYPVIKDSDVLQMPIPLINKEIQKLITEKIRESQLLKQQSEHLLEVAKRAVEIAIEENEDVATNYINDQLK